jgi:hypothetical protein
VHKASSFTPHFLHFGRELSNSVNLLLSSPVEEAKSYGEFATALIERMSFAFALARETLQGAALQAKRYYDAKVRPLTFQEGDAILLHCPGKKRVGQLYPK